MLKKSAPNSSGETAHTATGESSGTGAAPAWGQRQWLRPPPILGLSTEVVLEKLRSHNIEATAQDTIRTVATKANMKPYELVELLKQGKTD